jgi:hypothetical protein
VAVDERAWLACADPRPLLSSLGERVTQRKLLLFACACARRVWHLLPDPRCRATAPALLPPGLAAGAGAPYSGDIATQH